MIPMGNGADLNQDRAWQGGKHEVHLCVYVCGVHVRMSVIWEWLNSLCSLDFLLFIEMITSLDPVTLSL